MKKKGGEMPVGELIYSDEMTVGNKGILAVHFSKLPEYRNDSLYSEPLYVLIDVYAKTSLPLT